MFVYDKKYVSKKEGYYYSCPWIEHGLVFFKYKIANCCHCGHSGSEQPLIRNNFIGQRIDWNRIFAVKDMYRNFHKKGKIHSGCINCPYLKEDKWDGKNYITELYISHWTYCNSKCIYCYSTEHPEEFELKYSYNILPFIKEMFEKGILKPGGIISFGGGEPTILPEFEDLLEFLLDNYFYGIRVHSSGIKYSPMLARGIEENRCYAVISVDAGTSSTFEKIKHVPVYDIVRKNISKYALHTTYDGRTLVGAKFIIIPGINDTKEEVDGWLKANYDAGLYATVVDIEENWYLQNRYKVPEHIYKLIEYIEKYAKKTYSNFELYERIQNLLADKKSGLNKPAN